MKVDCIGTFFWDPNLLEMDVLEDFLQQIGSILRLPPKQQIDKLSIYLSVHPERNPYIVKLNNLGPVKDLLIIEAIERRNWHNDDWSAFDLLVKSFINLASQLDPWSLLLSFDLYSTYLNDACVAFSNKSKGHLLTGLFKDIVEAIIPMALQLDKQMALKELGRNPRLNYVAAVILKGFNHIRSLLGANDLAETMKKSILLVLGARLCSIYFILSNPLLCQNVFANMNNANLHISAFPKEEQLLYRFNLARFYMVKYQLIDAYEHFMWCLHNIPINYRKDNRNVSLILRLMIPISIILGKRPNLDNFKTVYYTNSDKVPPFFDLYASLLGAIKSGSLFHLHNILDEENNVQFLKKNNLYLFVASKSFILTLRNLLRKVWVIGGKQNRLSYNHVAIALKLSLNGLDISAVTTLGIDGMQSFPENDVIFNFIVENCFVTLIDQNLLRAKVFPRLRAATLAKTEVFPAVEKVYFKFFGNGSEGKLSYGDKWMA